MRSSKDRRGWERIKGLGGQLGRNLKGDADLNPLKVARAARPGKEIGPLIQNMAPAKFTKMYQRREEGRKVEEGTEKLRSDPILAVRHSRTR